MTWPVTPMASQKKKRPASSDGGKPNMPKKDSKCYGNILKTKSNCSASDDELSFPNRTRKSSIDHALKVIIDTMSLYYKRPTTQIGSKYFVSESVLQKASMDFRTMKRETTYIVALVWKISSIQTVYVIP